MDATLKKDGTRYTVRFERQLAHLREKVWRVLTERELLKEWFPCDVIGEWTVGAKLQFVFAEGEAENTELSGEVLAVEPPRLLEYRWGESVLRCELIVQGDGCRLIFSESFEDGSIAARNAAGWDLCLENMQVVLADRAPAEFAMDAWRVSFNRYVEEFEPLAGPQQGPPETHPGNEAKPTE